MSIQAMKQALEALEMPCDRWNKPQSLKVNDAITALRDAIEAQEKCKDAERYQKLRKLHWSDGELCVTHANAVKLGYDCPSGDRLDAMLDAMEEKE